MALRRTVALLLLLALLSGCGTSRVVRLDTGRGTPLEYTPSTSKAVRVDEDAFEEALTRLVLNVPMTLRAPQQGLLERVSYPANGGDVGWQRLMGKSFGGLCKAGQRRGDCLSLLDDAMGMGEWDKLGVALALSLDPMKESISRAVEETLAPQLFYAVISTGLVSWAVLAANPEPVFTKAAAIVSAVMLIYLGLETFLEVVDACRELKRTTDRSTMPLELEQAGRRFANRVGPEVARVFVLAVTMAVSHGMAGGAAWLASRVSMLPSFPEAAAVSASQLGMNLTNVWQVTSVAVVGNTVAISLPATAVAMVAQEMSGGSAASAPSGQLHHVISKRIAAALEEHNTLRGHYTARDPRFVTRAADKAAHNGYQKWHRDVDKEVVAWLKRFDRATPEEFESFLREIYSRPAMRARFPHGF
ncbi:hypothetical protein JY651_42240 [Pyxidicoccus parkwayensis]|uniref:Lipoprotein n=1 Tax=Pyxidicoccus parkwayensis TaxID=2813578 RepID=A0ABX7NTH5_9BACT|nr:hypothetical protein [Pyxidicoccus parkwaysis]QSQ21711.1 hypothetical protein JY651_42240 [Pyxidicoccus parkwaysis]